MEARMLERIMQFPEPKVTEKPETAKKPNTKPKGTRKSDKTTDNTAPVVDTDLKAAENALVGIKEYSSASEIAEKIEKEIAETKSTLGEYLRQIDDKRAVAEKMKKIHDVVTKVTNKKQSTENPSQLEAKGIEIVLDPRTFHELMELQIVVKSFQKERQRLRELRKVQEVLEPIGQFGDIEGIRYIVVEKEGIPERILLEIL